MVCPERKWKIGPSRCLTCEHFGGFHNSGVLCFRAKRRIDFTYEKRLLPGFANTGPSKA